MLLNINLKRCCNFWTLWEFAVISALQKNSGRMVWQNQRSTLSESIMMIGRTVMAESCLGGRFWFKAAFAGKDARNVTFKERIGMNPHQAMHGENREVSDFRA